MTLPCCGWAATVADSDYVAKTGTLGVGGNVNTQTVSVTVNGDTKIEPNETVWKSVV